MSNVNCQIVFVHITAEHTDVHYSDVRLTLPRIIETKLLFQKKHIYLLMNMDPTVKSTGQTKSWTSSSSSSKPKTGTGTRDHTKDKTKSEDKKKDATASDSKYTSEFLREKLREHFPHPDFKSTLQKDAIKEIMRGK